MEAGFRQHCGIETYLTDALGDAPDTTLSYSYFRRLFQEYYRMSPGQYLDQLRMAEAKKLLHLGQKQIKAIAEELGFESPYYFSHFCKKHEGVSPKYFC